MGPANTPVASLWRSWVSPLLAPLLPPRQAAPHSQLPHTAPPGHRQAPLLCRCTRHCQTWWSIMGPGSTSHSRPTRRQVGAISLKTLFFSFFLSQIVLCLGENLLSACRLCPHARGRKSCGRR